MNSSILTAIRVLAAPRHRIGVSRDLWREGTSELKRRGGGRRESGAFLLGKEILGRRGISKFVFYDDLDPTCLDNGIVCFRGSAYGRLWDICAAADLGVMADAHTHPGSPLQSDLDRKHPMITLPGHIALIIPFFAHKEVDPRSLGIYEYVAEHRWLDRTGQGTRFFYVGGWG
jgi:hypothetical protein